MKVTVKDGIKGFSGKLSFGGTASAGTMRGVCRYIRRRDFLYWRSLQRRIKNGGTASAGTMRGVLRLHKLPQTN